MKQGGKCKITVVSCGSRKELWCEHGSVLMDVLNRHHIFIDAPCGGKGLCGKCKVKVQDENSVQPDDQELKLISAKEKEQGYRLACRVKVTENMLVSLDDYDTAQIVSAGKEFNVDLFPSTKKVFLRLKQPTVQDQRDDLQRLYHALGCEDISMSLNLLRKLSYLLRESNFEVTVTYNDDRIIQIEKGNTVSLHYGVAVDIGTTTVVAYLVDLNSEDQIDFQSALNDQKSYGADVVSRITYTIQQQDGLTQLHERIVSQISTMVQKLAKRNQISTDNIYDIFLVGNTTMMHLLAGLPPHNIAASPFTPVSTKKEAHHAKELGLDINNACIAYLLPSVSGYVGADIVAAILCSDMMESKEFSLLIDIGTNGEIALGNKEKIVCCSTAAGPAFEGAHIKNGIGGIAGAINTVRLENGKICYTTIGNKEPIGICGSGIVDILAVLLEVGIVDETGRIMDKDEIETEDGQKLADRIFELDGMLAFIIADGTETKIGEPIVITQKDVREIQLAKAAIAAGINILIKESGRTSDCITRLYLAGGFGSYIDKKNAIRIGLLPEEFQDKIIVLGNAAGTGAVMSLLSKKCYDDCDIIKNRTTYIELSTRPDFQDEYVNCMYF